MPTDKKQVVVTIHGIWWKSKKEWQNDFGVYLKSKEPDVSVFHFRYGYLMAVASWWMAVTNTFSLPSAVRAHYVRSLRSFLAQIKKKIKDSDISVIAHSFGGWLIWSALVEDDALELKNLVLVHTPISAHIEQTSFWNWLEFKKVKRVFAWSSHKDMIIGKLAVKPFGQNGYWGFIRQSKIEDRTAPATMPYPIPLYNIHTEEDHGGPFNNLELYGEALVRQLTGSKTGGIPAKP